MKKQILMFTAVAMLAAALAGCGKPVQKSSTQMGYIGEDAAKNMAVTAAQVDTANASFSGVSLDEKDGIAYYGVDFTADGTTYHYAIDAMTGAVIESSSGTAQTTGTTDTTGTSGTTAASQTGTVDEARAKQIALEHAGVSESDTTFLMAKQDYENGTLVYEVEFYVAATGTEYDYEIDAATGEVRSFDYDAENYNAGQDDTTSGTNETKSEAEIRAIALAKVPGATENDIRMNLDRDDGKLRYEGKIIYEGMEYDFEIDAYSGAIQEWDAESVFD